MSIALPILQRCVVYCLDKREVHLRNALVVDAPSHKYLAACRNDELHAVGGAQLLRFIETAFEGLVDKRPDVLTSAGAHIELFFVVLPRQHDMIGLCHRLFKL